MHKMINTKVNTHIVYMILGGTFSKENYTINSTRNTAIIQLYGVGGKRDINKPIAMASHIPQCPQYSVGKYIYPYP